jgi:hypothetical protein
VDETVNFGESDFYASSYLEPDTRFYSAEFLSSSTSSSTSSMGICTPELLEAGSSNSPVSSTFQALFHAPVSKVHDEDGGALDCEFAEALERFDWMPELDIQFVSSSRRPDARSTPRFTNTRQSFGRPLKLASPFMCIFRLWFTRSFVYT